jgi:hypothetical protein
LGYPRFNFEITDRGLVSVTKQYRAADRMWVVMVVDFSKVLYRTLALYTREEDADACYETACVAVQLQLIDQLFLVDD